LRERLESCRVICRLLEQGFVDDGLTGLQRIELFRRWDATLMENQAIQIELESLEKQQHELA
jgi:hypothetical protein